MLRVWQHLLQRLGFSCALRLLQVVQLHLMLRLWILLGRVVLLLLLLLCPAFSNVRRPLAPVGAAVAGLAMGPTGVRRSVRGVGLLPLDLLLAFERSTIALPPVFMRKIEPLLLLPELDVRLEVFLPIFTSLQRMAARRVLDLQVGRSGRPHERSVIDQVLVVDPPLLRERRMTTGRVLSTR